MRLISSVASEIVHFPRSSRETHSWIPYRSGAWARNMRMSSRKAEGAPAREWKKEQRGALPRLEGLSLCEVGWALKSQLC